MLTRDLLDLPFFMCRRVPPYKINNGMVCKVYAWFHCTTWY